MFSKMQAQQQAFNTSSGSTGPQPLDIGLMYKGKGKHKGKGKSYKGQSKGKTQWHNKGKGYTGYNNSGYGKGKAQTPIGYGNALKASGYAQSKERQKVKDPRHGKETEEKAKEHATNVDRWATWQEIVVYECTTWQKRKANKARTNNNTTMRSSTTNNSMTHTANNGMNKRHGSMTNSGFQSSRHKSTHNNKHQPCNRHR